MKWTAKENFSKKEKINRKDLFKNKIIARFIAIIYDIIRIIYFRKYLLLELLTGFFLCNFYDCFCKKLLLPY